MVKCNESVCPICGGRLQYYNKVRRIRKTKLGEKQWIDIRRLICKSCHAIHRELPNDLLPYKHYEVEIIRGVVEGTITPYDLEYEDYPCLTTMADWKKRLKNMSFNETDDFMEGAEDETKENRY